MTINTLWAWLVELDEEYDLPLGAKHNKLAPALFILVRDYAGVEWEPELLAASEEGMVLDIGTAFPLEIQWRERGLWAYQQLVNALTFKSSVFVCFVNTLQEGQEQTFKLIKSEYCTL